MKKNFIEFSWIFHSSEVHEKPFHRVVPMNRLHFIDLKSNLMGNSYKEDLVVNGKYSEREMHTSVIPCSEGYATRTEQILGFVRSVTFKHHDGIWICH